MSSLRCIGPTTYGGSRLTMALLDTKCLLISFVIVEAKPFRERTKMAFKTIKYNTIVNEINIEPIDYRNFMMHMIKQISEHS